MRLWVLGSGSGGNAALIEEGDTRVLVDSGFSPSELARRLAAVGIEPRSIAALVITHEHIDHVRGAAIAARRWGWTLHASEGTVAACPPLADADARSFEAGATLRFGPLEVCTVSTSHDAADPVAVVVTSTTTGVRGAVATDMGRVTPRVRESLRDLDFLVLEANHDDEMLHCGPYPAFLKRRIAGAQGHLSNAHAAAAAQECASRALQHVVLAHLSETNNTPRVAAGAVGAALSRTAFRGTLHVAAQNAVLGPIAPVVKRRRAAAVQQLSLAL